MTRVPLLGGAYQARSVITAASKAVNLYPEINPPESQAPVPVTHYPRPGLTRLAAASSVGGEIAMVRCTYRASNGDFYVVVGQSVYYVNPGWEFEKIGDIPPGFTPVSMADNGLVILIVNGGSSGWCISMNDRQFGQVNSQAFYGSVRVEEADTYFILVKPFSQSFYISGSNVTFDMLTTPDFDPLMPAFDPLDIASKTGQADNLQTVVALKGELWLLGSLTSEVWVNSGAADFTYQRLPGSLIEHGCAAIYSAAKQDTSVFWLSQDQQGHGIVVQTNGYQAMRISTHAIEAEFQSYSRIDDAIGFCYQILGHAFYVLTFPTADASWAYELASKQWHRLAWCDVNGELHRYRGNCAAFVYGANVTGDWQNGTLYKIDPDVFTDAGDPIVCIRSFPHMVEDGNRIQYQSFIADMQVGTYDPDLKAGIGPDFNIVIYIEQPDYNLDFGPIPQRLLEEEPQITLRWSDDRGVSYSNGVKQSLGKTGEYLTSIQWNRLGMARDRVFEVSWSSPVRTALQGAFVDVISHST